MRLQVSFVSAFIETDAEMLAIQRGFERMKKPPKPVCFFSPASPKFSTVIIEHRPDNGDLEINQGNS